jgi:thiamine kinase-like enzyme
MNYNDDRVFQAIQQIRQPEAIEPILTQTWKHWLGKQPQAIEFTDTLTYYRPFDRARIVAEAKVITDNETPSTVMHLFFNVFAKSADAIRQLEGSYERAIPPSAVLPVFLIDEWQTVVWTLPHAPSLHELNNLLNPEYFCRLLIPAKDLPSQISDYPAPQIFRYVPFKRAILTWSSPVYNRRYFVKLCLETDFSRVVGNFQQMYAAAKHLNFIVPKPIAVDESSHSFSMTAINGEQFTSIMCQTQPQSFAEVGKVLAQLHQADVQPERIWTPEKELKTFYSAMSEVKLALPCLTQSLDRAIAKLSQTAQNISFLTNHPIHGNLFGDQILYSVNQIGIVDWDTLSLGDPHYDIGRLIAHFIYLAGQKRLAIQEVKSCIAQLLESYEQSISWTIDLYCLTWQITTQLLLRGKISSLRKLSSGWQEDLKFVVAEAEWLIEGCSEYISLPALNQQTLSIIQ